MLTIDRYVNIKHNSPMNKNIFSTNEVAQLLGISRIAIFKKIKSGEIKAEKMGRNYIIHKKNLPEFLHDVLGSVRKREIEKSVKKTVKEYGQTLKMLGRE